MNGCILRDTNKSSHFTGATVVLYFLKWVESPLGGEGGPNWVNEHIETFVNIGGPLLGVPKALSALLSGNSNKKML